MSFKKFFVLLFIVSFAVFLYFQFILPLTEDTTPAPISKTTMHKPGMPSITIEPEFTVDEDFMLLASLVTSILSFSGFLLSSYHSIRGNRREEEIFNLQKEKERLELDKIRAEIQALNGK